MISEIRNLDLLIHIGEVSGDYSGSKISAKKVWRVSEDGELKDTFMTLTDVFEMTDLEFFSYYATNNNSLDTLDSFYEKCKRETDSVLSKIPELPYSNAWVAQQLYSGIPHESVVHFGILNSLRAWNFYPLHESIESHCNVGGFGIDGPLSTLIGASFADQSKLHFLFVGDLAFFYDMNALGNRYVGSNIRILLINNGRGAEFRIFCHPAFSFGQEADRFIAASGHNGNKSDDLVRNYVENLGFEYLSAHSKDEFLTYKEHFLDSKIRKKPMLFEVFTSEIEENEALEILSDIEKSSLGIVNKIANQILDEKSKERIKKVYRIIKK